MIFYDSNMVLSAAEKFLSSRNAIQDSENKEFKENLENLSQKIAEAKKEIENFSLEPDESFLNNKTNKTNKTKD